MAIASVVLDIQTRSLESAYSYLVPDALEKEVGVGATVLVTFGRRPAVGYVVAKSSELADGVDPSKLRAIEQVLEPSAFDETAAELALWISREYACPAVAAIRLFLPPGSLPKAKKAEDGSWTLTPSHLGKLENRWVGLSESGKDFTPRADAYRQRELVDALSKGPLRLSELKATLPGVASTLRTLEKRGVVELFEGEAEPIRQEATTLGSAHAPLPERLTKGQAHALTAISRALGRGDGGVVLVDGVTGSGKTEVYLEAIEAALALGRGAIVLVPEISLTPQTLGRFRSRFGDEVALMHSRLTPAERRQQWMAVSAGKARVVVGARSALFCPVKDLGLVVIDEEHEFTYKQEQAPRYHARDVAAKLVQLKRASLVLGSATPSLESLKRCEDGEFLGSRWERVRMPDRATGALLPNVTLVDLRGTHTEGSTVFSPELADALRETHRAGEKAVLLINRRGFSPFLICEDCGCVPECPHCSSSLTYHAKRRELVCHSCGSIWPLKPWPDPTSLCPHCGSRYLRAPGVGTERVEGEVRGLLPDAEVIRMDADTTSGAGAHQRLLERFDATPGAVLVGTQMIAKGLDFPEVTLVGVVNADTSLKLPDFRSAERTFDLLEQVTGRAGRGEKPGRVIIQSYWSTHPAVACVASKDRESFVRAELALREEAQYPPYVRLANITASGADPRRVESTIAELSGRLREAAPTAGWQVVGPAECLRAKIRDRHRHHVLVKAPLGAPLGEALFNLARGLGGPGVSLAIDVDAYEVL